MNMRFSSSSLQLIPKSKMPSSRAPYRGRNPWQQRGLSNQPNTGGERPNFRSIQHDDGANFHNFGHQHTGDAPNFRSTQHDDGANFQNSDHQHTGDAPNFRSTQHDRANFQNSGRLRTGGAPNFRSTQHDDGANFQNSGGFHRQHTGGSPNFQNSGGFHRQYTGDAPNFQNSGEFHWQHFHQPPPQFHQPPLQFHQPPPPSQFQNRQPPPRQPQPYQQQSFPQNWQRPPHLNQGPPPPFNQQPRVFRPANYKPPDFRNWEYALSQPPSHCERFVVLSYNILADYLAINHRRELYWHIPHRILDWEWRKGKILFELGLWSPDIMCLQEVDRFQDLEEELKLHGYSGIWKMRTGVPVDGCAIFWRTRRFTLLYEESIEFNKLGLRDNVAQICVLESKCPKFADSKSDAVPQQRSNDANRLVICNIHVLYNPRRGEMKLGQIRALLEKAYAVSKLWDDAPVVICGDFNCTPKSSLYNFIAEQKLDLTGLARDHISGQSSAEIKPQRLNTPTPRHDSIRVQAPNNSFRAPNLADEKKEACLEPDNFTPDMHCHNKANNDGETELQSQSSTSVADTEISGELLKGVENNTKNNLNNEGSSVTDEIHPLELGNAINPDLTAALSKPESSDSMMVGRDESNGCTDQSIEGVLPDNSQLSNSIVSTVQEMSIHDGMDKEKTRLKVDITCLESNLNYKDSRPDKTIENARDQESLSELDKDSSLEKDGNIFEAQTSKMSLDVEAVEDDLKSRIETWEPDEYLEKQTISPSDEIQDRIPFPTYDPSSWTPMEIETATGNAERMLVEHPLKLRSTYTEVEDHSGTRDDASREPQVTSYHRKFMGTVDYIWRSEGLQTVKVLDTIPKHALQWTPGFPTPKWGSDHIALVSQLAFTKGMDQEKIFK